jgi:four helix bundle protein
MTNYKVQTKTYDLEERTLNFAKKINKLCTRLSKNLVNSKLISQIVRSAGSVGANYLEANDSLGKKDFIHRLKISRKETKETIYWLKLLEDNNKNVSNDFKRLIDEAIEIRSILSAIINKVSV